MPIGCPFTFNCLTADEFATRDYRLMSHAFASQNELGRLCDERVYEADLKARLEADGFRSVATPIPVTISYQGFSKTFRLDLVADDAVYELKAEATLIREHEAQLLNYLFLLGIRRGKLLNFRPPKVQGRIVATSLTPETRRRFVPRTTGWEDLTPACENLRRLLLELLQDWGAFFSASLYQEAVVHLLGGDQHLEQRIDIWRNGARLGGQRMYLHSPKIAFRLSGFTDDQTGVESHLRRLVSLTKLEAIQWISLNHSQIEFRTITRAKQKSRMNSLSSIGRL